MTLPPDAERAAAADQVADGDRKITEQGIEGNPSIVALATTDLTETEARAVTNLLRQHVEISLVYIKKAYEGRAWIALDYASWDDYIAGEIGEHVHLPRDKRRDAVLELREAGLSTRAISSAIGVSKTTVVRELAGGPNGPPAAADVRSAEVAVGGHIAQVEAFFEDHIFCGMKYGNVPRSEVTAEQLAARDAYLGVQQPTITGVDGKSYKPKTTAKPKPGNNRRKHFGVFEAVCYQMSGIAMVLDDITELDASISAEVAGRLADELDEHIKSVERITHLLGLHRALNGGDRS